jgi:hypothetical protein
MPDSKIGMEIYKMSLQEKEINYRKKMLRGRRKERKRDSRSQNKST